MDAVSDDTEFWFCLKHHAVEGPDGCRNQDRLGPYPSSAEAARALERIEERNEAWDSDPRWNDDIEADGPGEADGAGPGR